MHSSLVAVLYSTHTAHLCRPRNLRPDMLTRRQRRSVRMHPDDLCCLIPVSLATHATCMRPSPLCSQLLP